MLERWVRPTVGRYGWPAYLLWGTVGYGAGLAVALALATHAGADMATMLILAIVPASSLYAAFRLRARLVRARVVFFEKGLAAFACTAFALFAAGEPVWRGLDPAVLGIGAFLAFGRLGCLASGCCHGRPARIGVRYGRAYLPLGFPLRWIDVPVFPVQLLDAAVSAGAVAVGAALALGVHRGGAPAAAYACCYGVCRFALELLRGDNRRPHLAGVSEAQWIALALAVVAAIGLGSWWTVATAAGLALGVLTLITAGRFGFLPWFSILSPRHVAEVERATTRLLCNREEVTTSAGLRISPSKLPRGAVGLALSLPGGRLSAGTAARLVRQVGFPPMRPVPQEAPGVQRFIVDRVPLY